MPALGAGSGALTIGSMTATETLPDSDGPDIEAAVIAWHQGDGEKVAALPDSERREALRRLGYSTPHHLALLGL